MAKKRRHGAHKRKLFYYRFSVPLWPFFVSFTGCIIWSKASGNRAIFSLPSFIERGELDDYFNRKMISRYAGGDGGLCDNPRDQHKNV